MYIQGSIARFCAVERVMKEKQKAKKIRTSLERWWLYPLSAPIGLIVAIVMDWIEYYNDPDSYTKG